MSVQCGVVSGQEAVEAVMDVRANLEDITRTFGCEDNAELAALYYEARKSLDELKKQLKKSGQAGKVNNFFYISSSIDYYVKRRSSGHRPILPGLDQEGV